MLLGSMLGLVKKNPKVPAHFEELRVHLWSNGIRASVQPQDQQVSHADSVALLVIGLSPSNHHVVTLAHSESPELAAMVEAEAQRAPQFTPVRRNGRLVMACTFTPPNAEQEARVASAFMEFRAAAGSAAAG
jgi:hypothetical protein